MLVENPNKASAQSAHGRQAAKSCLWPLAEPFGCGVELEAASGEFQPVFSRSQRLEKRRKLRAARGFYRAQLRAQTSPR